MNTMAKQDRQSMRINQSHCPNGSSATNRSNQSEMATHDRESLSFKLNSMNLPSTSTRARSSCSRIRSRWISASEASFARPMLMVARSPGSPLRKLSCLKKIHPADGDGGGVVAALDSLESKDKWFSRAIGSQV